MSSGGGADLALVYGGLFAASSHQQQRHDHQYFLYPPLQGPPAHSRAKSFDADIEHLHAQNEQQSQQSQQGQQSQQSHRLLLWVAANRAKWVDAFLLFVIVVLSVLMVDALYQNQNQNYAVVNVATA